jgi:hypothetical protein
VERWKVVAIRPFFSRDANKPLDDLRLRSSGEDEISGLTEGTELLKNGAQSMGILSRQTTRKILNGAPCFGNFVAFSIAFGFKPTRDNDQSHCFLSASLVAI